MAMFILLTAGEADHVRGPSAKMPWATLEATERQGGAFILGLEVLADPAHEAHWAFLAERPQLDSADPAFPPAIAVDL